MANVKGKGGKGFYILIVAVLIAGGVLLWKARGSNEESNLTPVALEGTAIAADMSAGTSLGVEDAPAVIMEFSDFRCPHCRRFNSLSGKLLRQNYASSGALQWLSFDFPLWPESWAPAIAAQCAKRQGKYWEMKDLLFARVDSWIQEGNPNRKFVDYARDLGLDADAFKRCVDGQETVAEVQATQAYGESLGIDSTPTVFFNGERVTPQEMDYGSLEERIKSAAAGGE